MVSPDAWAWLHAQELRYLLGCPESDKASILSRVVQQLTKSNAAAGGAVADAGGDGSTDAGDSGGGDPGSGSAAESGGNSCVGNTSNREWGGYASKKEQMERMQIVTVLWGLQVEPEVAITTISSSCC